MTYNLGQAQIILTANNAPIIAQTAQAFSAVQASATQSANNIAAQYGLTVKEVQNATRILEAEAQKQAKAIDQSALSVANLGNTFRAVGGTAATLLGFGAIASGAVVAREAIVALTETTLKQEQAQLSLNASYAAAAPVFKEFADSISDSFHRSNNEVEQGVADFGVLQKEYGTTSAEIEKLTQVSLQLQAAYGGSLATAFRSVQSAIEGQPRALDKYGISLRTNAIQSSADLTEEQKKLYSSMGAVEGASTRLEVLLKEVAKQQDATGARTQNLQGTFDALGASVEKFNKELGNFAGFGQGGAVTAFIAGMGGLIDAGTRGIGKIEEVQAALEKLNGVQIASILINPGQIVPTLRNQVLDDRAEAAAKKAAEDAAANAAKSLQDQQDNADKATAIANDRAKAVSAALQEEVKEQARAHIQEIDDQIKTEEARKTAQLNALESVHKAELDVLASIEYERKQAAEAAIRDKEAERDGKLRAIEQEKKDAIDEINAEKNAEHDVTDEAVRNAEISKEKRTKANEDAHDAALRLASDEKQKRDDLRVQEDREVQDSIEKRIQALEDEHLKATRAIEDESTAAHKAEQQAERDIESNIKKEDDRHTKKMENIDKESKSQLDAIDKQIKAIDDAQKATENANKTAQLQDKVGQDQLALQHAQGTGSPADVLSARNKLTSAIRLGDPTAVKKAQDELLAIAGQGDAAIATAQKNLATSQKALLDEGVKETQDAAKEKLQADKDAITATAAEEKKQEDDRDKRRKETLDLDKQAAKDRLSDAEDKINKEKRDEQDKYDSDKRGLADDILAAKRQLEDRRRIEDENYTHSIQQINDRYKNEQEAIKETYDSEDHGIIPALRRVQKAADEGFQSQTENVNKRYDNEKQQIEDTYNGPKGIIEAMHLASEEAAHQYSVQVAIVNSRYEAERKAVEAVYRNSTRTGILDLLDKQKEDTTKTLDDILAAFKKQQTDLVGDGGVIIKTWQDAIKAAKAYFDYIKARGGTNVNRDVTQAPGAPGVEGPTQEGNQDSGTTANIGGQELHLGTVGGSVSPTESISNIDDQQVEKYIRDVFGHQINNDAANDAVEVWSNEGRGGYVGDNGTSFGPFQLHLANDGHSLGNAYENDTGDDLRNASHWRSQIDYVVNYVKNNGWAGQWHGAPDSIRNKHYDQGGMFYNPTLTYDLVTGQQGKMAENGPEMLIGRQLTKMMADRSPISMTNALSNQRPDYSRLGAHLGDIQTHVNVEQGDNFTYMGVAPADIMKQWRNDQRRQRILRGAK